MIKNFTTYILESKESRKSIEDLEMLNPEELGKLLIDAFMGASSPDVQYIQDLLDVGCPIDARNQWGETPLMVAVDRHFPINDVKFLISKGADVNSRNIEDRTPLHVAIKDTLIGIAKLLLSKGADVNSRDIDGKIPLHLACSSWYGGLDVIRLLVSKVDDINARDDGGWTPLHYAVLANDLGVAKFLISKGADIHVRTGGGNTAWDLAPNKLKEAFPELNPN